MEEKGESLEDQFGDIAVIYSRADEGMDNIETLDETKCLVINSQLGRGFESHQRRNQC